MSKRAVLYGRVSREEQAAEGTVSIDEQFSDMRARVQANAWQILKEFTDQDDYKATQAPKRGKMVNCSGERADRPQFLAMLDFIRTGEVDVVMCWRDDRLVRHPRVAVALEDALDEGDLHRNGAGKIRVCDATGAEIDRLALSIKATIWREENKRRAERTRMGKIGTLKAGRWPGEYSRLGYSVKREASKRGVEIVLSDKSEVDTVRYIFHLADAGHTCAQISEKLILHGAEQKGKASKYTWSPAVIDQILRAEDYTGKATWYFADGAQYSIPIPQIISPDLWQRVQTRRQKM